MGGYGPQLKIAAAHILEAYEQGTLQAVAVADPDAGRVDDLQLVTSRPGGVQVDAFQVKWSRDVEALADAELRGLIVDAISGRSTLRRAWKDRRAGAEPVGRIVVHLHTNRPLSTAPLKGENIRGRGLTLPRFISEVWRPAAHGDQLDLGDVPECWREYVTKLAQEADTTVDELLDAAADVRIEPGRTLPEDDPAPHSAFLRDINAVVIGLLSAVTDRRNLVVIEALPFLEIVGNGFAVRWQPRSAHNFPVPPDFQPMGETELALDWALSEFSQGYVFLTGTPGSGKSTLLSQRLTGDPRVAARYYAFVPGNDTVTRGEAHALLHDLLLALDRRKGLRTLAPSADQLAQLRVLLRTRLAELGSQAIAAASVAIIVIDGLDHVLRDPAPERPLLDELLPADEVPEGVLFVLGTRNTEDLPLRLQADARLAGRHIRMAPLTRSATLTLADHAGLEDAVAERVWQVSGGHPLLARTFTKLAAQRSTEIALVALQDVPALDGEAMRYYASVWGDLQDDTELVGLLGLVCRLRGPVDLEWLERTGSSASTVERLGRLSHLFNGSGTRWRFFHDSFREFLRHETSLRFGSPGEGKERELHAELARRCAATARDRPQAWEAPHHLLRSGGPAAALALATPEFFRAQVMALRPPGDVFADVREVASALADEHDAVAVVRLTVAAAECRGRGYHQAVDDEFLGVLLDLGYEEAAFAHLRQVSEHAADDDRTTVAMELVVALHDRDRPEEARRILDEYEPLHALSNRAGRRGNAGGSPSHLYAWARAAVLVHGADYVADQTTKVIVADASWQPSRGFADRTQQVRYYMIRAAADCAAARRPPEELAALFAAISDDRLRDRAQTSALLNCAQQKWHAGKPEVAAPLVEQALAQLSPGALTAEGAIEAAELLYRLGERDEARRWLDALPEVVLPASQSDDRHGYGWRLLLKRLRLTAALDGPLEPANVFAESPRPHERIRVVVARHLTVLANLWGRSLRGEAVTSGEIADVVRRVLNLWNVTRGQDRWRAQGGYDTILAASVALASAASRTVVREYWTWWKEHWAHPGHARSGGLQVIEAFRYAGIGAVSLRKRLQTYAGAFENDSEFDPSIWVKIAAAWIKADDLDAAREALDRAVAATLQINFRKDYQLSTWIRMLRPLIRGTYGEAIATWLTDRIEELDEHAEPGAARDAAHELLKIVGEARSHDVRPLGLELVRRDVFDVDDVIRATLDTYAASADETWWTVVAELLVPIGAQPISFERACAAAPNRASLARRLRAVGERVAVEGRPSQRLMWRRALAAAAEPFGLQAVDLGIAPSDLAVGDETPTDGWEDSDQEDVPAPPTLDDLRAQVQDADDEHFVRRAATLAIAELEAGDEDAAWQWALEALQRSDGRDWDRWYAGGPALDAARVLHAADSSRATPLVFACYANAASTDDYLLGSPVENMDRTIEAFGPSDADAVAQVVLEYVAALFDVSPPDLAAEHSSTVKTQVGDVAELITWLLGKEHLLAWRSAQRALLAVVRAGGDLAAQMLVRVLADDRIPRRRVLDVLDVVVDESTSPFPARAAVVMWLSERATGARLDERVTAMHLLARLDEPVPQPTARDLPLGLRISVPRAPSTLSGASDIGSTDVDTMLAYSHAHIERLARVAGVDVASLSERVRARATAIAATCVGDDDLRQRTTVLGWGFVRPSATALFAAQNEIAAELVDCGRVASETALAIVGALPRSYTDLLARRPERRPTYVPAASPLAERTPMRRPSDWLKGLDGAAERLATGPDSWFVIGELTELALLGRADLREQRSQALIPRTARQLFTQIDDQLRDTLSAPALQDDASLIMSGAHAGLAYSHGFIGLHPTAARAAELQPDTDDPLAWTLNGRPAVRTVWWRSGFAQWPPYYERDEVGDGWLVLATPAAVSVLLAAFPGTEVAWEVQRKARDEDSGDELPEVYETGRRRLGAVGPG